MFGTRRNKIIIYTLLMGIYISVMSVSIVNNKVIRGLFLSNTYTCNEYKEADIIETHDCNINAENKLDIIGVNPYFIIRFEPVWLGNIQLDVIQEYLGQYKIYYTLIEEFSEEKVAEKSKNIYFIGEYVDSIRIDFEQLPGQEQYELVEDIKIIVNGDVQQMKETLYEMLILCFVYVFISAIYILNLFVKKDKVASGIITWIYSVLVSCIWLIYISKASDQFMNSIIFLIACCGMLFWGNYKMFGEEK